MSERVCVVGSPTAKGAKRHLDTLRTRLDGHDVTWVLGDEPGRTAERLAGAVGAGLDRLVVVGGDGSVHLAAQHVATTGVVLGVVPAGTGNDFARAVGLLDVDDPVAAALGPGAPIDAMRAGDRWIASVATLGFGGDVTDRANRTGWLRGEIQYSVATLLELPGLHALGLRLDLDGEAVDVDAVIVAVANTSHFGGGMAISPGARPDDGRLEVAALGDVGRLALLRLFAKVFRGTHLDDRRVRSWSARSVGLSARDGAAVTLWGDGEPVTPLPVTITVVPDALVVAGVSGA